MRMPGCWGFLRFCCAATGATAAVAARTAAPLSSARRDINDCLLFIATLHTSDARSQTTALNYSLESPLSRALPDLASLAIGCNRRGIFPILRDPLRHPARAPAGVRPSPAPAGSAW